MPISYDDIPRMDRPAVGFPIGVLKRLRLVEMIGGLHRRIGDY